MVFRLHPRGLQWDTHMKCKRQIKLTSAMILRLEALSASSLPKDTLFPCKISACRRSSSRPHVEDVGAAQGTRAVLPGVSTCFHHRLTSTDGILIRSFIHLVGGTFLRLLLADNSNLGRGT